MQEHISSYVVQLNKSNVLRRRLHRAVAWCSLSVVLVVFWCLKLTGITLAGEAFCGQNEHIHRGECFTRTVICGHEEVQGHAHSEECHPRELICGHGTSGSGTGDMIYHISDDTQLIVPGQSTHPADCLCSACAAGGDMVYHISNDTQLVVPGQHIHTEACWRIDESVNCGQEVVESHTHSDECFESHLICTLTEHFHEESCYCKLDADLETRDDWEMIAAGIPEATTTAANVVLLAESQLGYTESTMNFVVDEDLSRRGITRYGQWYGNPYGDWSAMFASFCLYYAGVEDAPVNAGPESMRLEWADADMYRSASEYAPRVGDVIFLQTGENKPADTPAATTWSLRASAPAADTVALIKEITEDSVVVIQGDVDGTVSEVTYSLDDAAVLGYGLVPEVSAYAARAVPGDATAYLAKTIKYSTDIFTSNRSFVIYTVVNGNYYAIDGAGNAVPIYIDTSGEITMDAGNRDDLLWTFTKDGSDYAIQNVGTGMYLHPHVNSSSDRGALTRDRWPTRLTASGDGVLLRHTYNNAFALLNSDQTAFDASSNQRDGSIFRFGVVENCTVWLDGTYSNVVGLRGSDKSSVTVMAGDTLVLPTAWKSPEKYTYVVQGWYDVKNARYYAPGDEVIVTENLLFYPDWVAATYDIGVMNEHVVDVTSTAEYVTTHVFDYNPLFNTLSTNNSYSGGDSTQWTLVSSGAVRPTGKTTLDFVFVDYDTDGVITYPNSRNVNNGTEYTKITPGLYDADLADLLFDPDVDVLGKTYLGTGDYLFRYCDDPENEEFFGYYFYDSHYNAASYNQSRQRFYVYDYLERTTDSAGNDSYADFLPLNSPYANTNGKATGSYTYNGEMGEYAGVEHVSYDTKYSDNSNSTNRVGTNFWFGMATDMEFYLPATPGILDENGESPNKSTVGKNMIFEFSGDDDVWVLIDDQLVLDIGGIHTEKSGSINFATGDVIVEGSVTGNVRNLKPGSHKLTMYYLERGGSMSNYKLRFNISPRYSLTLRKEDTLTAHMLNGAEFSFYLDEACSVPAELWPNREAHDLDRTPVNTFEVTGGTATMWGFAAGGTYYIKETSPPASREDSAVEGIIRLRLNNEGRPDYEVLPDENGNLTVGFTAHGFKMNEDTQAAYLVISNTDATDSPPTQVYVDKVWNDGSDHSGESVTVHLLANGIQIQSVTLNEENDWKHIWENLPEKDANGKTVTYTVREATVPGYIGTVADPRVNPTPVVTWNTATTFTKDGVYLIKTGSGYIGADSGGMLLESSEAAAKVSKTTRWVATAANGNTVTLKNEDGRTMYYNNGFYASSSPNNNTSLTWTNNRLRQGTRNYLSTFDSANRRFKGTTSSNSALSLTLYQETVTVPDTSGLPQTGFCYRITNTPVGKDTVSLTVHKEWDVGQLGHISQYESISVEMKLLADGVDAGLRGTVALRTGWSCTFAGLPKYDGDGKEIAYSVEEVPFSDDWHATYSQVTLTGENAYEVTVTNRNHMSVRLPETTGRPPYLYTLFGTLIILGALGWYCGQRRKGERRGR